MILTLWDENIHTAYRQLMRRTIRFTLGMLVSHVLQLHKPTTTMCKCTLTIPGQYALSSEMKAYKQHKVSWWERQPDSGARFTLGMLFGQEFFPNTSDTDASFWHLCWESDYEYIDITQTEHSQLMNTPTLLKRCWPIMNSVWETCNMKRNSKSDYHSYP